MKNLEFNQGDFEKIEITPEDIEKEIEKIKIIAHEYMSDAEGSRIFQIKELLKSGDREAVKKIKEEVLEDLDAQITFIDSMEKEELNGPKNRLKMVMDYYRENFE